VSNDGTGLHEVDVLLHGDDGFVRGGLDTGPVQRHILVERAQRWAVDLKGLAHATIGPEQLTHLEGVVAHGVGEDALVEHATHALRERHVLAMRRVVLAQIGAPADTLHKLVEGHLTIRVVKLLGTVVTRGGDKDILG